MMSLSVVMSVQRVDGDYTVELARGRSNVREQSSGAKPKPTDLSLLFKVLSHAIPPLGTCQALKLLMACYATILPPPLRVITDFRVLLLHIKGSHLALSPQTVQKCSLFVLCFLPCGQFKSA